jgi:hypothetical protein
LTGRKLLVASIGVASVNYAASCAMDHFDSGASSPSVSPPVVDIGAAGIGGAGQGGGPPPTSGNLVAPPPTSGNLMPVPVYIDAGKPPPRPDAGPPRRDAGLPPTSGNLVGPPPFEGDAGE